MSKNGSERCNATKKSGEPCKNFPMTDCDFCYIHSLGKSKGVVWWKNPIGHLLAIVGILATLWFGVFGATSENQRDIQLKQDEAAIDRQTKHDEVMEWIGDIDKRAEKAGITISPEDVLAYRSIVAKIYGDLQPKAIIRLRDTLPSLTDTTSHVVDISIRSAQADQEILTIVNAFPRSSPVDEDQVLAFASLLSDVGASKGVLVCNSGFTRSAKALAPTLGIGLTSVQDAQSRKWHDDIDIPVILVKKKVSFWFKPTISFKKGDTLPRTINDWHFSVDGGTNTFTLPEIFIDLWERKEIPRESREPRKIALDFSQWKLKLDSPQEWRTIKDCSFLYRIDETAWLKYYTPTEYTAVEDELSHNVETTSFHVQVGPLQHDTDWIRIPDKELFLTRNKGVLILFEESLTSFEEMKDEEIFIKKIE
ncbi:MAG: hypothetical protein SCALA701_02830 [Candidatus Scalindua sp.]|nr:hypothetical protein [Planctomycetota bacterium]GJQ57482.1 MAG: hypothetical protein SCALA701_02830 [Candidatus Scalindua sp.]